MTDHVTEQDTDWESEMGDALTSASQPALDEGGAKPRNKFAKKSSSFAAVVADLEVGECASRVQPLDPDMTMGEFMGQMSGLKATLINNAGTAVVRARRETGGVYKTSASETMTTGGQFFLVLIVQRVA